MSDPPVDQGRADQSAAGQAPIKNQQFHGMGRKGQASFAAISISTLQDLAHADAATVESELKARGYSPGLKKITDWISQAQDLISDAFAAEVEPTAGSSVVSVTATTGESAPKSDMESAVHEATDETSKADPSITATKATSADNEAVVESGGTEVKPESSEPAVSEGSTVVAADWKTFTSFTVNFEAKQTDQDIQYQTSVHQTGTDAVQTWQGLEETKLQAWLLEHLASAIPNVTLPEASAVPAIAERLSPYISDLQIFQLPLNPLPMQLYQPSLMFPSPIQSNLPFTLKLQFGIPVSEAESEVLLQLGRQVTYTLECYARSLVGKEVLTLGKLEPQQLPTQPQPFVASLPEISLPSGIFRLQLLLNLQGISAFPAYFEVPALQVD